MLLQAVLGFLEEAFSTQGEEVEELIAVSFLEHLPRPSEPGAELRQMLGPRLAQELRRMANALQIRVRRAVASAMIASLLVIRRLIDSLVACVHVAVPADVSVAARPPTPGAEHEHSNQLMVLVPFTEHSVAAPERVNTFETAVMRILCSKRRDGLRAA